jgi:hypothetical protein
MGKTELALSVLMAILGYGGFFAFLQFLITKKFERKDKLVELQKEFQKGLEEREETGRKRYEEHKESIEKLNEAIMQLVRNDNENNKYMHYVGDELMGLAHDKLVYLTDRFQRRGAITLKEKNTLQTIYEPYHDGLGGNGDGKTGYEYAMQLPVVTDEAAAVMDADLRRKELEK